MPGFPGHEHLSAPQPAVLHSTQKLWMPREPAAGSRLGDFWPTALRWVDENHDANPPTEPPWPTLRVPDGPRAAPPLRNLRNPSTYVVSLAGSHSRRRLFARQWNALEGLPGGFEAVRWLRAVNGSRIPPEVANPAGSRARGQEAVFRARPGILGCSLSHMLAFRLHLPSPPSPARWLAPPSPPGTPSLVSPPEPSRAHQRHPRASCLSALRALDPSELSTPPKPS